MSQLFVSLSIWLHALATVILVGHYLLLSILYLPVLEKENTGGMALSAISRQSRFWLYASMGIFAVTGVHLTFVDSNYLGLGNFSNPWSILMLVKHILILGMVGIGFWYNALLRIGPALSAKSGAGEALANFRLHARLMAGVGVLVLLLTALAQAP